MAARLNGGGSKKAALPDGEDRISALPAALLQQVLSFLPSRDAARTCVLATAWRDLWKSVPTLRINTPDEEYGSPEALEDFVNNILRCRDKTAAVQEFSSIAVISTRILRGQG